MNNHTHTQYTSALRGNQNREKTTELFILYVLNNYIITDSPPLLVIQQLVSEQVPSKISLTTER